MFAQAAICRWLWFPVALTSIGQAVHQSKHKLRLLLRTLPSIAIWACASSSLKASNTRLLCVVCLLLSVCCVDAKPWSCRGSFVVAAVSLGFGEHVVHGGKQI